MQQRLNCVALGFEARFPLPWNAGVLVAWCAHVTLLLRLIRNECHPEDGQWYNPRWATDGDLVIVVDGQESQRTVYCGSIGVLVLIGIV